MERSPKLLYPSRLALTAVVLAVGLSAAAHSQSAPPAAPLPEAPQAANTGDLEPKPDVTLRGAPKDIWKQQKAIWTSPAHIREHDLSYLVPLGLATTLAITTDHQVMASSKLNNTSLNNESGTASNGLIGGFIAAPVILYGMGHIHHDDHAEETGILAGEAMIDSIVVQQVMKLASMRERPGVDNARGRFFQTSAGFDSSFPSSHSIVAWSSAAVFASEYPGPLTKITAYGLATGESLTRILARQHFPSDVIVGSAVGWLIGRYVVHRHHKYAGRE